MKGAKKGAKKNWNAEKPSKKRMRGEASSAPSGTAWKTLQAFGASKSNTVAIIKNPGNPLPDTLVSKMKFSVGQGYAAGTNGALAAYQFTLTNPADPMGGLGAVAYRYYSTLATLYRKIRIYGFKVTLRDLGAGASARQRTIGYASAASSNQITDAWVGGMEIKGSMVIDTGASGSATSELVNTRPGVVSRYYTVSELLGVAPSEVMNDPGYASIAGAAPSYLTYFYLVTQSNLVGTTATTHYIDLEVTAYIKCSDLIY